MTLDDHAVFEKTVDDGFDDALDDTLADDVGEPIVMQSACDCFACAVSPHYTALAGCNRVDMQRDPTRLTFSRHLDRAASASRDRRLRGADGGRARPTTGPARIATVFSSRWVESPVAEALLGAGLAVTHYADPAALLAESHGPRLDCALVEDHAHHFIASVTALRVRGGVDVPIIAVGRGAAEEIATALQGGAADYAVLGDSLQLMVNRVQARLLLARETQPFAMLRVGECWLEEPSHSLHHPTGRMALTPREFALAWVLFEHAGQTVTMDLISQQVWGRDASITKRTMEQHVSRLRAKLTVASDVGEMPLSLKSVHNIGYRLAVRRPGTA